MAIIKCPECGGAVSTTAKQCIHCGCKFTVCPECGTPIIGKANACPECGWKFSSIEERSEKIRKTEKDETITRIFDRWRMGSFLKNISYGVGQSINDFLGLILIGIVLVMLFVWRQNDPLSLGFEALFLYAKLCRVILFGLVICLGFPFFYKVMRSYYLCRSVSLWCKQENLDLRPKIKENLECELQGSTVKDAKSLLIDTSKGLESVVFGEDRLFQEQRRNTLIKDFIFKVGKGIFLYFIGIGLVDNYMGFVLSNGPQEAQFFNIFNILLQSNYFQENAVLLISFIAYLILFAFVGSFFKKAEEKSIKRWVDANMPEQSDAYDKRIKNMKYFVYELLR